MYLNLPLRSCHSLFTKRILLCGLSILALLGTASGQDTIGPFAIPAPAGQRIEYSPAAGDGLTVVCFLGTECPLVRLYAKRLSTYADTYGSRKVRFIGVDSNHQDSLDEIATFSTELKLKFPFGKDPQNKVADQFGAQRTPEVFLLDEQGKILYRGRIDDQFSPGVTRSQPTRRFLVEAMEAALDSREIEVSATEAEGCLIGRVVQSAPTTNITFANEVSRLLQRHCVECHRPGQIGPMSLTDYDEVVGWGEMLLEVVDQQRMPPWHASPEFGSFANAREMPEEDKKRLRQWVRGGMPFGQKSDLPPPRRFVDGWRLPRAPDLVLPMRERPFQVPADGTVEYQYFVVDPQFKTDRWVRAAEVIPGNRSVVHHSIVFVRPPDGARFRGVGWLSAYVPGQSPPESLPGFATRIPAGSKLVFQQHYTPNGTAAEDITKLGLVFADPTHVTHEIYTLIGLDQEFEIAPHSPEHKVQLKLPWFPKNGILLSAAPHMHYRGKSFDLFAKQDGQSSQLLKVPNYDFNWQHSYRFEDPIALDDIEEINFEMAFDNSENNPFNPDASQPVTWGDQTWEEMAVAFFNVAEPLQQATLANTSEIPQTTQQSLKTRREQIQELARTVARDHKEKLDAFFNKFDKDGDGKVARHEVANAFKHFGFSRFDDDGDGFITRDEWAISLHRRLSKFERSSAKDK